MGEVMAGKGKLGRSSKLTDELQKQLVDAFELGATDKIACGAYGLGLTTYYKWMREGDSESDDGFKTGRKVKFRQAVMRAKSNGDVELLAIVRNSAARDPKGGKLALELLARRHPEAFAGSKTVRHAGHDGGPMAATSIDLSSMTPDQLAALVEPDAVEHAEHGDAYNDADNVPAEAG
jgi:hypothetical protein